ncbi:MAG: hypothetical protein ACRDKZ_04415 [Actinomycetota bacterium]
MIDLERALVELDQQVAWPAPADLSAQVVARIEQRRPSPLRKRVWWYAPAAAALVLAILLVALPGVRTAVADFLGLGGVSIEVEGTPPTVAGENLSLGESVTLDEAEDAVDYTVRVPGALGVPDAVFHDPLVPGGQIALGYRSRPRLPATPDSDLGALVTQFPGTLADEAAVKKFAAQPDTSLRRAFVGAAEAYWITGEPHFITYIGPDGEPREETIRLVGNVLLWAEDGITYRIESALSLPEVLAIARSM